MLPMRRTAAFTLVEIMIVISIIALLAAIAVPAFLRARQRAQNAKFINALRIASDAITLYAIENGGKYPADVNRGVVPPGMATYLDQSLDWTGPTPIGGRWDWDFDRHGAKAAVAVVDASATAAQMLEIDTLWDDGDLTTGRFRQTEGNRYADIVEQ
jgi:prepilin-type N-terminal cleavage/methylation domain-containing protein